MSEFKGIHREAAKDGTIKHVWGDNIAGHEQAMAAKDDISEGIQPEFNDQPEVPTDREFPKNGQDNGQRVKQMR